MSKKTIGHVELTWICPNCATRNGGLSRSCVNCGSPQPENVQFTLDKNAALLDKEKVPQGPDIHCPYCGSRNPFGTAACASCGGDLSEGAIRAAGRKLSQADTLTCKECGHQNPKGTALCENCGVPFSGAPTPTPPAPAQKKSPPRPWMFLPVVAFILLACSLIWLLFFKTSAVYGSVSQLTWTATTPVEVYQTVTRQDWLDEIPMEGTILSCEQRSRGIQDSPAANSKEICETEIVDAGDGTGTIEETCVYEVYDDFCSYEIDDWVGAEPFVITGSGTEPNYNLPVPNDFERFGATSLNYSIIFDTQQGSLPYSTDDLAYYRQFSIGSEWMLSVNKLGGIVEISR